MRQDIMNSIVSSMSSHGSQGIEFDLPKGLSLADVVYFYEKLPKRRPEIASMYFSSYATHLDWYHLYNLADKAESIRALCIREITKLVKKVEDWITLYKADENDDNMRNLAFVEITKLAKNDIKTWLLLHDNLDFQDPLQNVSLLKAVKYASTLAEWEEVYKRCSLNNPLQPYIIRQIWRHKQNLFDVKGKRPKKRRPRESRSIILQRCEELDIYSNEKDFYLMNLYLSLDEEKEEDHNAYKFHHTSE